MTDLRLKKISIENNQLIIQRGNVSITNTQSSNNSTTGSLISHGGISISNTVDSTSYTSGGALTIAGGMSVNKNVFLGQSIFIKESLNVSGITQNRLFIGPTSNPQFSISPNGIDDRFSLDNTFLLLNFTNPSLNFSTGSLVINGGVSINTNANSTGYTNGGALTIAGGMSVNRDVYMNENAHINGNVSLNGNLQFNNSSLIDDGNLQINSNIVNLNTSTLNANINGKRVLQATNTLFQINSNMFVNSTTSSINSSTGSFVINGGISINNSNNSTSIANGGALTISGGMSVQKNVYIGNSLNVSNVINLNNISLSTSSGSLLVNSIGGVVFNDTFKINNNGSLETGKYILSDLTDSFAVTNKNSTSSQFNIYNNSTDNTRDTLLNVFGVSNPLSIGWKMEKYQIQCQNNDLHLQNHIILSTNGSTFINNNISSINSTTGTLIVNGGISINNTTNATSNVNGGALTIAGGLAVNRDILMGNKLQLNSDIQFSSYINGSLDISSLSTPKIKVFNRNSSSNDLFSLDLFASNTEFLSINNGLNSYNIESKTSNEYKNLKLSSNTSFIVLSTNGNIGINKSTPLFSLDINGSANISNSIYTEYISVNSTENSTGNSTGSLKTLGGAYIGKNLIINENLNVFGNGNLQNVTMNNLYTLNNNVSNDLFVSRDVQINRNLILGNKLTSNGTVIINDTSNSSLILFGGMSVGKDVVISGESTFTGSLNISNRILYQNHSIYETNGNFNITRINNSIPLIINQNNITLQSVILNGISILNDNAIFQKNVNVNGVITINNTQTSSNSSTGSLVINGGLGLNGNLNMNGDLNILGNLSVLGTVSNINSANININDNILFLNSGINGSRDGGLLINRYQIDNDIGSGDIVSDLQFTNFTLGTQTGLALNVLKLPNTASSINNFYNNYWVKVISGFSNSQVRQIISYNGITKEAVLSSPFTSQNPNTNDIVYLYYKRFVGLIWSEINDTFVLGSTTTDPSNGFSSFTSYSCLMLQDIHLLGNTPSINSSSGSLIVSGGISIKNTVNSTSNTSGGALTIAGGVSINKNTFIGGSLHVNNVDITPNSFDIISPLMYNAFNNTVNGLIPKLSFNSTIFGVTIYLGITLITSGNLFAFYTITLINKSTSWEIASSSIGDDTSIQFTIDNSGNVLYTTPNYSGFTSLTFKYKAVCI